MAVTINGKIYRNVKNGQEGIFINGQPVGGGTQLYKHSVTFKMDEGDGEPIEVSADLINTVSTSLAGKAIPDPEKNIHGILTYDYSYNPILYIDSAYIVWCHVDGSSLKKADISGNILTDRVTQL